jgi:hypothetical protein
MYVRLSSLTCTSVRLESLTCFGAFAIRNQLCRIPDEQTCWHAWHAVVQLVRASIWETGRRFMIPITVEVDIEHGKLTARQPGLLPDTGTGLLTVLPSSEGSVPLRTRVSLPLVRCVPGTFVSPTAEDLDDSLWD